MAGTRYPTLRQIARDIYAIPVTTVASDIYADSTSGRVLSDHRSSLTIEMVEALMCSQDWFRNKYKGTCISKFTFSFFIMTTTNSLFPFVCDGTDEKGASF